jgi:6-pyruvoyltetrahydropterin/6-carboxytetrahydropterin synthase
MYEVKVIDEFSASHQLRDYIGKCENAHGHNWKVEVICRGKNLNKFGLVFDFKILKEKLGAILEVLDHVNLNDLEYFKKFNPSSENIAYYIYMYLSKDAELIQQAKVLRINVWENDTSCASYYEET